MKSSTSTLQFHSHHRGPLGSDRLQRMFRTLAAETTAVPRRLERFYPVRDSVVTEHEEILDAIREETRPVKRLIDHHMQEAAARLSLPDDPTDPNANKELHAP